MDKKEIIKVNVDRMMGFMGVSPDISISDSEEDTISVAVEGQNLNFLIGYRGESLDALQTILGLITFKETGEWVHVLVDINGYRKQKQEKIEQITKGYIDKVRFFGKDVEMSPMIAYERRQVHTFISEYDDIISESTGEGPARRVVLKPKK
ncbi:MAG: Single-stranded nucleic acid binding R3H domain protein [candidate division WWE3 bacterium GW2011_GWA1_41_8]|uniref:Single-stranded nucleic acid binding R3H domain protein n=1 Tax=candidate division WWE3 bacterium GW2011_GWA1_41_8 TaxID=1619103 RepID=A0A0G0X6I8_UNCKA|nr:MAG: Single-stranded nucleic acid binding R3H domain protein [candidate division WWE3 bacterium GW2011_GWA1_41_8]